MKLKLPVPCNNFINLFKQKIIINKIDLIKNIFNYDVILPGSTDKHSINYRVPSDLYSHILDMEWKSI